MKKHFKRQIETILELLDKAHTAIKKALETGNGESTLALLEQCQNSAIQIGGMIEESLGEDFITVGMLEDYCEQAYQMYEMIRQEQHVNINGAYKKLRKALIRIENSVKNDIRVRTTAVFLPYKASMWDSLESVWKAADGDPDCDAYVVPIPYFDKNSDGSFGEMHYEGNTYPEYVPITSWEEYDIEAEHPDIIFIHNPYDEFNRVTSVPPVYYSKELKKKTDMLIYIPYYILKEIDPNNKEEVKSIKHFCTVSAVVYADRVIVQSKKWRQIYIDVMTETMGNDTRNIWEKKILGLGSPKMDRVLVTRRDNIEIPKDWLSIIEKSDGSWKKIFFYNTSVSALLQHGEKMLKKIESVFRSFQGNREEVALLWRPHPLIKATIESMRPQLWAAYEKLVNGYKEEGWGIYDDTADLERAIAISDAYYGDPSSVVQLCEKVEMPIMLQNVETLGDEGECGYDDREGMFYSCLPYAKQLWFVSLRGDLMVMDREMGQIAYVDWNGDKTGEKYDVVDRMLEFQKSIYWLDFYREYIHEYNPESNEYNCFAVPEIESIDIKNDRMAGIYIYKDVLWLFLRNMPSVLKFDLIRKSWEIRPYIKAEGVDRNKGKDGWMARCSVRVDNEVYVFLKEDGIVKVNLDDFRYEYINVLEEISDILNVIYKNHCFYILTLTGNVYRWDEKAGSIEIIYNSGDTSSVFSAIAVTEHKVFLLPRENGDILSVELEESGYVKRVESPKDLLYRECSDAKYGQYTEDSDYIWFDNRRANYILRINKKSESIEWVKPTLPALQEEWNHYKEECKTLFYDRIDYLNGFLEIEKRSDRAAEVSEEIGMHIWDAITTA